MDMGGWLRAGTTLLLGLLIAGEAAAARFIVLEEACRGRQLLVQGPIESGDAERFIGAIGDLVLAADLPAVQDDELLWTVKFDSSGGDPDEAMAIGRWLRRGLAATEVSYRFVRRDDGVWDFARNDERICLEGEGRLSGCFPDITKAECAGACVLAWLGGADRFAHEGEIGSHGLPAEGPVAARVARYLEELELAPAARAILRPVNAGGPHWLSWPERSQLAGRAPGLAAGLEHCPAALTQQESLDSVMHADLAVRDRLMDRAAAHRSCRMAITGAAQAALRDELAQRRVVPTLTGP